MTQNVLNNVIENVNNDYVAMTANNKMPDSYHGLDIDPENLSVLKKNSSTATARRILKYLYPHPSTDLKLSDINSAIVTDIIRE